MISKISLTKVEELHTFTSIQSGVRSAFKNAVLLCVLVEVHQLSFIFKVTVSPRIENTLKASIMVMIIKSYCLGLRLRKLSSAE